MTKLSPNFSIDELTRSEAGLRCGIDNRPRTGELFNLQRLCRDILEPLRTALGRPVRITSGYRCSALNAVVGGSHNSDHVSGCAADIEVDGVEPKKVCYAIIDMGLPFKQVIYEFGPSGWCHVSIEAAGKPPRREVLSAVKVKGKTIYSKGIL